METLALDLESFYSKDHSIDLYGSVNYLAHPDTDTYLLAVTGEDGHKWSGRPADFDWNLITDKRVISHNFAFDGAYFQAHPELPRAASFNCTANLAGYLGSPHALTQSAERLLGEKVSKDLRGKMKGRQWQDLTADEQASMTSYCERDAQLSLQLWTQHSHRWPAAEQRLSQMTIEMCHAGVHIDRPKLKTSIALAEEIRADALGKLPWEKEKPLSLAAARTECARAGIPAPTSFAEKDEGCAQWETRYGVEYPFVGALRDLRKSNILLRKLQAMERRIMTNGRMNYDLRYAGAHTLRWAGAGGFNVQNMAREPWRGIYLRSLLIPEEGKKFIVCDLSAIEPRVLAYLAGDEKLLQALREGFGVYEAQATVWGMWSGQKGTLKKKDPALYGYIKSLSLGCGYGMGAIRFRSVCAQRGIVMTLEQSRARIAQYRARNPAVIRLWQRLDHELQLQRRNGIARLSLPSGRALEYGDLRWEKGGLWANLNTAQGFRPTKIWGGFCTENATQAVARDVFAHGLLALDRAGIQVVLHAHDEVVVEVNPDITPADIIEIMTRCPDWIKGLPLAAEAKEVQAYAK